MRLFILIVLPWILIHSNSVDAQIDYSKDADLIRSYYEQRAFELPPSKAGHMGCRLYRQYGDKRYKFLILQDIKNIDQRFRSIKGKGLDPASLLKISRQEIKDYNKSDNERYVRRRKTFDSYPTYRLIAVSILGGLAKLNNYGLKCADEDLFRKVIHGYNFKHVFRDPVMIRAWGAQLANQVYWLKQLGERDLSHTFSQAVRRTYPNSKDHLLSQQQFTNKIYTLTHIIISASEYYQKPVNAVEFSWILDYFSANLSTIIKRCNVDVIAEVGLSYLLAEKEDASEVEIIRAFVSSSINKDASMIPSSKGGTDFVYGEHRNILAVMLLDWQGTTRRPYTKEIPELKDHLPTSLVFDKSVQ